MLGEQIWEKGENIFQEATSTVVSIGSLAGIFYDRIRNAARIVSGKWTLKRYIRKYSE